MLFTQDSTKLQKLCPYLHVVSLLRDQIPGRAWNPDNSSFDPVPVGSTTLLPLPSSFWPRLRQRERVKTASRKKNNRRNTCRAKKNRCSLAEWIVIPVSVKRSRHKKCLDRDRMRCAILALKMVFIDHCTILCKYLYGMCLLIGSTRKNSLFTESYVIYCKQ